VSGPRGRLELRAGDDVLTLDPAAGGRIASLVVDGHELIATVGDGDIWWGCYPMAPFAGRIRDGILRFRGATHQLERSFPPNAIHGTVFTRPWRVASAAPDSAVLTTDLGPGWPFSGRVTQTIELAAGGLGAAMTLEADEPMPAWLGWHPWFRRQLAGVPLQLSFEPSRMYVRAADGLPTGEVGPPTPRPWDDAFTGVDESPRLTWPGVLELELSSTAAYWVVFDERDDAMCVEPQTAPPDAVNLAEVAGSEPPLAEPGRPVTVSMTWRWWREPR
jgi:aldose 1-epimerase